nr:helix-turn-helix transcriptional regulator [Kineosporia babensis]
MTAELKRLREASGLTIDEVAQDIGVSKSALSRIENGLVGVKLPVLRALFRVYEVTGQQAEFLERLSSQAAQKGWWQYFAAETVELDATKTLIGLEEEASTVNDFSLTFLSGLLQTRDYARAVIRGATLDASDEGVENGVQMRLRRQQRLGDLRLWSVIAEEALMRPIGGPQVMRAQIEHLIAKAQSRRITVQVLAKEHREHPGITGPFVILGLEPPLNLKAVYLEGNLWDACLEGPDEVALYERTFDVLRAMALSPQESLERLQTNLENFT